jgi:type IV fimbrial biogenesis protein FimT
MNIQRGFTILEVMTVIAIAGVLLAIGIPNLQTLLMNNRIVSQINTFSSSLALARSEAAKLNQRVVLCPSADGVRCTAGADWNVGWLVFVDRSRADDGATDNDVDDDGAGDPNDDPCGIDASADDQDDCILSYTPQLQPNTTTLRGTTGDFISYSSLGNSNMAGTFVICDNRGAESARAVIVSTTGRASISRTQANGTALACTP